MPGTDHRGAIQFAFGERAAAVAANVIDRIELAVDIEHADCFAVDLYAFAASALTSSALQTFTKFAITEVPF